jgi:hypothetical protein
MVARVRFELHDGLRPRAASRLAEQSQPDAFGLIAEGISLRKEWLRGSDLNRRPPGYEPDELPGCSTPRLKYYATHGSSATRRATRVRFASKVSGAPKSIRVGNNTRSDAPNGMPSTCDRRRLECQLQSCYGLVVIEARRPVEIEKYFIHCKRMPFVSRISNGVGLSPC